MRRLRGLLSGVGGREFARRTRLLFCLVSVLATGSGAVVRAQGPATPPDEPIHTLHVYTNLLQIPTLVLGPNREPIVKPIAESRFSVSIDSGRWFRATHVRLEGDDPISLSILLDVSGDAAKLMPKIDDAIANLAPSSLHPKDRISIYALNCSLVRSLNDVPARQVLLKDAVDHALASWTDHRADRHAPKCESPVQLWDALAYMVGQLYKLPGRRVILVVSEGQDKGSRLPWNQVRAFAQSAGVAVFGITPSAQYIVGRSSQFRQWGSEDPFQSVCQLSGGMVLATNPGSLEENLNQFVALLRGRYIVEFPRPANSTAGEHSMEVKVEKSGGDFIRSAGISVPIPDAAVLSDPTTVPSDPSLTPEQGRRHPVRSPQ